MCCIFIRRLYLTIRLDSQLVIIFEPGVCVCVCVCDCVCLFVVDDCLSRRFPVSCLTV